MSTLITPEEDAAGRSYLRARSSPGPGHPLAEIDPIGPELRRPGWDGVACDWCARVYWIAGLGVYWSCPTCGSIYEVATITGALNCEGTEVTPPSLAVTPERKPIPTHVILRTLDGVKTWR